MATLLLKRQCSCVCWYVTHKTKGNMEALLSEHGLNNLEFASTSHICLDGWPKMVWDKFTTVALKGLMEFLNLNYCYSLNDPSLISCIHMSLAEGELMYIYKLSQTCKVAMEMEKYTGNFQEQECCIQEICWTVRCLWESQVAGSHDFTVQGPWLNILQIENVNGWEVCMSCSKHKSLVLTYDV